MRYASRAAALARGVPSKAFARGRHSERAVPAGRGRARLASTAAARRGLSRAPMPELLPKSVVAPWRRLVLPAAGAVVLYGLPVGALAQEASTGLRACAAESDPARRLACYDKEMGRKPSRAMQPAGEGKPAGAGHPVNGSSAQAMHTPTPPPTPASPSTQTSTPASTPTPAPKPADREAPTRLRLPTWKMLAGGASSQLTAHVSSVERWPDAMILHLDNGQVWQQTGRASGD